MNMTTKNGDKTESAERMTYSRLNSLGIMERSFKSVAHSLRTCVSYMRFGLLGIRCARLTLIFPSQSEGKRAMAKISSVKTVNIITHFIMLQFYILFITHLILCCALLFPIITEITILLIKHKAGITLALPLFIYFLKQWKN